VRLLVTGGAGFIGSYYARHVLATTDDHVRVLDLLTYAGGRDNVADLNDDPRFRLLTGDICERECVKAAMAGHDAVVHFAAETHVDRSIVESDAFVRTNCFGTNVPCDVARHIGVKRFVHISTDEVYGSIATGSSAESDPLRPSSPYSASKAGGDLIALSYHATHGLPVVVTRSSNTFGPNQFPDKVIPRFVTNLLDSRRVPLYGDGAAIRDWCYVVDSCRAIDLVLRAGEVGGIYNIGAGNALTNRELTARLVALVGMDDSAIELVPDRPGHDMRYSISTARVRSLGWEPTHDFDEALAATVAWYRDHRDWWSPRRRRATTGADTPISVRR
jgi:dTDP-glucose 4,6-dehydratase